MILVSESYARRAQPDSLEGMLVSGSYRLLARLGGGSMGEVYAAEHVRLGSPVAIKLLRKCTLADPRAAERFQQEARRLATICCENVVRVFDCGELEDGTPFLVMERLFGEDLRTLLARERTLPVRRAVKLSLDVCRGLAVVHAAGLVHRDLKPANLFVVKAKDGTETCKVLDFGAAKMLASDNTTRPGTLVGTIRYMAPEQLENAAAAKAGADIYALGAILYEALTGVVARTSETLEELMFEIIHRDVRPASQHRPLPQALDEALLRALSRDASRRFPSAESFAAALTVFGPLRGDLRLERRTLDDTLGDSHDSAQVGLRLPRASRSRAAWLGLTALLLGAMGGWWARSATEPAAARPGAGLVTAPAAQVAPATHTVTRVPSDVSETDPEVRPSAPPPSPSSVMPDQPPPAARRRSARRVAAQPAETLEGRFDPKDPYE